MPASVSPPVPRVYPMPLPQAVTPALDTTAVIGKVRLTSLSGQGESQEPLCQITLRITNTDSARKIDYRGWQSNTFMSDSKLTDNVGNRYKGVNFGFGDEIVGQVRSESIYPGKSVDDLLVFEVPVDAAKSLNLELPASNVGETGQIRFLISREMWSVAAHKPKEAESKEADGLTLQSRQSRALPANRRYLWPRKRTGSTAAMDARMRREVVLVFDKESA